MSMNNLITLATLITLLTLINLIFNLMKVTAHVDVDEAQVSLTVQGAANTKRRP